MSAKAVEAVYTAKAQRLLASLAPGFSHALIGLVIATHRKDDDGAGNERAYYTATQWRAKQAAALAATRDRRTRTRQRAKDLAYTIESGAQTMQAAPKGWKPAAAPRRAASRRA